MRARAKRSGLRRAGLALALLLAALALLVAATARPGDPALFPPRGEDAVTVHLVANGWHSGLVLPRETLARAAAAAGAGGLLGISERFRAYEALEIGWGDAGFYRQVPTLGALDGRLALAALFTPGGRPAVLHVVGIDGEPASRFPAARILRLRLSPEGFARLAAALGRSVRLRDGRPIEAGPGLYGPSLFYEAEGRFSLLHVCNHWTGDLLNAAGLPVLPVLDTLPDGLLLDLARQERAR
ncbi:DUF2459 domain-containing protein [Methylobacterium sp. JK268]